MKEKLLELLDDYPIIAAVKEDQGLEKALDSDCNAVFVLYGNIMTVSDIVASIKERGKMAFIHVDLLEGASSKEVVIKFLSENTDADGIISSKAQMVRSGKKYNFTTIHRFFLIDSMSYHSIDKQIEQSNPDFIDISPGGMTKTIGWVKDKISLPIIASGLVCDKEDVVAALKNGAVGISSTNTNVWSL